MNNGQCTMCWLSFYEHQTKAPNMPGSLLADRNDTGNQYRIWAQFSWILSTKIRKNLNNKIFLLILRNRMLPRLILAYRILFLFWREIISHRNLTKLDSQLVGNWVLMSCQLHGVTSGRFLPVIIRYTFYDPSPMRNYTQVTYKNEVHTQLRNMEHLTRSQNPRHTVNQSGPFCFCQSNKMVTDSSHT